MPKRTDIKSILIIGAGPIVIGQACEFDYSGAQACKALREEGYRVVLVNSNPATIMTDPDMADATYIEPVTWQMVEKVIALERPDALLPTMGGQTALNCALDLARHGVLEKYGVEMIGARKEAIDKAEDREKFKAAMSRIGLDSARSAIAHSLEEALQVQAAVGFPAIIRPSFTLGAPAAASPTTARSSSRCASAASRPLHQGGADRGIGDRLERVRDGSGARPQGQLHHHLLDREPRPNGSAHRGLDHGRARADADDKEYQIMRDASIAVLREIGVDTGGSNVQFAINPDDGRMLIIEMNPARVAFLGARLQGDRFPIAKVRPSSRSLYPR